MADISPSNLGDYIKVSLVSTKVILTALSVLAAGFIFWCFCGSVTDREFINGVVFPEDGITGVSVPNDGTVREIMVHKGDMVMKGQTLALISISGSYSILSAPYDGKVLSFIPENERFTAFQDIVNLLPEHSSGAVCNMIAYADYNSSHMMRPGQEIQATPMSETRERIGFVSGRIKTVSPYPVTRQEALMKFHNTSLADGIFPQDGTAFEIRIELDKSESCPEELKWSFPLKEKVDMSTGTFCSIEVITKSRSVFEYLMENVQETRNSFRIWAGQ